MDVVAQLLLLRAMGPAQNDRRAVLDRYVVLFEALTLGLQVALPIFRTQILGLLCLL